jgi:hypothetical protein
MPNVSGGNKSRPYVKIEDDTAAILALFTAAWGEIGFGVPTTPSSTPPPLHNILLLYFDLIGSYVRVV